LSQVVIDHKWRSVVVAIRGTLSLKDCIADALAESSSLAGLGKKYGFDGEGEYAHAGMMLYSEWIMEHLAAHQISLWDGWSWWSCEEEKGICQKAKGKTKSHFSNY